jgi:hypothetical protein
MAALETAQWELLVYAIRLISSLQTLTIKETGQVRIGPNAQGFLPRSSERRILTDFFRVG